ncbi:hypothetical protein DVH24_037099 [Malus domestica]|uniref:Transmembrane protein n=1 Tax=Malus domestica TaxID=3750 RepID=A0A498HII6_MALDO|nr:hypothetical protein DVH24_037099 [Malus domestica]
MNAWLNYSLSIEVSNVVCVSSLCVRVHLTVLCEWFPIVSISGAVDPSSGWDRWVFVCSFLPLFFLFSPLFSSLDFLADLPFSLPFAVSLPSASSFPASVTLYRTWLRRFELVCFDLVLALGRVILAPPPSLCCLPLLAVLLVDCHELLSLGCRFSGVCRCAGREAWTWMLVAVRRGFVWGPNLTGSTCPAAILVVAAAVLADVVAVLVRDHRDL